MGLVHDGLLVESTLAYIGNPTKIAKIMIVAVLAAALGSIPLSPQRVLNGRHGQHDESLSIATHCTKVTYAYGETVSTTAPTVGVAYTVVCESDERGGGWTYNTRLPTVVDTYANAFGAILVDSPNACVPAHDAVLLRTAALPALLQPSVVTNDAYWIRHLRLQRVPLSNKLAVHGTEDADLMYDAAVKSCSVVLTPTVVNHRTGPLYFAVTDHGVYQGRALATDYDLNALDYERLQEDSSPVGSTLDYHAAAIVIAGLSSALPLAYPWAHLQNVGSCALYFVGAFVCGSECSAAKPASLVAASLLIARVGLDVFMPFSKFRIALAIATHASAAVATFALHNVADGLWVPPSTLIEFQGSVNTAGALMLLPAIWH